jgi:hypothetical protein
MDKIDDLITATVVTSSLQPGGALKRAVHSSITSALKLAKSTLNKSIPAPTTQTSIELLWVSSRVCAILWLTWNSVLHPNYKLEYFRARKWEKAWIETAESLIREEFQANYASTANGDDQGTDGASDGDAVCFHMPRESSFTLIITSR